MPIIAMYGCHNEPRPNDYGPTTTIAQAGWSPTFYDGFGAPHRTPVLVEIPHTMSTDCRYDKQSTDPRCAGCQHIK